MPIPAKWLISITVLAIIVVGAWYLWQNSTSSTSAPSTLESASGTLEQKEATQMSAATSHTSSSEGITANSDLDADLQALDSQMTTASQSSGSAQTFDDQPVEQTEY